MDEPYHDESLEDVVEKRTVEVAQRVAGEPARSLDADTILDTLLPGSIDWRDTVRRHPVGSVVCVGLVGYLVGRTKGSTIMAGLTAGLSSALMRQLSDVFDGDLFDF